jgi:uncharacterized protein
MAARQASWESTVEATEYSPFMVGNEQIGMVHWLRQTESPDTVYAGIWKVDPVEFDITFPGDETFHLINGSMRIEIKGGEVLELSAGSLVSIAKGTEVHWIIRSAALKFFVLGNI